MKTFRFVAVTAILLQLAVFAQAQEPTLGERASDVVDAARERAGEVGAAVGDKAKELTTAAGDKAEELTEAAKAKAEEFEQSERAKKASAAVLEWVQSAEQLYRPWINWCLIAVGIGLFISHAGQLILGKLWALVRGKGFNFFECVNDFLVAAFAGLSLPVVLLIPTGHGAFISSPIMVLSAAAVGMILGVILYTHGMKQEMLAAQEEIDRERAEG